MQFANFFCYRDIGSKAFFTMATLLMPLLENEYGMTEKLHFSSSEKSLLFTFFY